jgi:hypothetical protein
MCNVDDSANSIGLFVQLRFARKSVYKKPHILKKTKRKRKKTGRRIDDSFSMAQ